MAIAWEDGPANIFEEKCSACHNSDAKLGGLDLTSYQAASVGGDSGPVIVPGDPDGSELVALQVQGDHPGLLNEDELTQVSQWITDGALER